MPTKENLDTRLARVEARLALLERERPGRKAMPIVVSEEHVCGVDPDSDSAECPHASLYRRQKGCLGDACVKINDEYYANRRKAARAVS